MRSNYNPIEHAVSDYAAGPTRTLTTVMTWTTAGLWVALAVASSSAFPDGEDLAQIRVLLLILAAIFIALPFLPTDVEGKDTPTVDQLHLFAAVAWFALAYTCMGNFVDLLEPITPDLVGSSLDVLSKIALVSLVALVAALLIRPARRYAFGIAERVFLVAVNVFYILVAVGILAGRAAAFEGCRRMAEPVRARSGGPATHPRGRLDVPPV